MAVPGFVESLLGGVEADLKRVLVEAFRYVLPNGRFGPIAHQTKLESFQAYYSTATTNSTANDEFSIVHGMGRTPYFCQPVVPLDTPGAKLVRLEVSRAADGQRVYLKSPEASAPIAVILE